MRKSCASIFFTALMTMSLLPVSCGGGSGTTTTATETLEEILTQAADLKMVQYDCIWIYPEGMQTSSKVWFKENKMKIERISQGQVIDNYLIDMDTETVYMWLPPENEPQEMGMAPGEISDFVSSMTMAKGISLSNPTIIGSESLDGKDCLVVKYNGGVANDITIKAWLWKEKRFLVRYDLMKSQGTVTIEFENIDFGDIPDGVFELPSLKTTQTYLQTMTTPQITTTTIQNPTADIGTRVGNIAPDFQLQDIEGQTITLSSLRGNPVILNFWATWCGWCVVEMPYLQEMFSDWQDRGLVLLAINKGETHAEAQEFMESNNLSFTALLDTDEAVSLRYGVSGIPVTIFIDKDGVIQENRLGAFLSKDEIESYLVKIMP